jgi:hypothetical protein
MKKPEPGDNSTMQTMQIDAVGDLEGIQIDDSEAIDAPATMPPPSIGRGTPPPLPAFSAQHPPSAELGAPRLTGAPAPATGPRKVLVYGAIFVLVAIGITAGVKLGSALRGPAVAAAPSAVASAAPVAEPSAAVPSTAPTVMRLDTIEVRDPPADTK